MYGNWPDFLHPGPKLEMKEKLTSICSPFTGNDAPPTGAGKLKKAGKVDALGVACG